MCHRAVRAPRALRAPPHALTAGLYQRYERILSNALSLTFSDEDVVVEAGDRERFVEGLREVPAYPQVPAALRELAACRRVVIVSNSGDDLIAATVRRLGEGVQDVVTAQQAGAYKPAPASFALAHKRVSVAREEIVHVGPSGPLDMVPARPWPAARVGRPPSRWKR